MNLMILKFLRTDEQTSERALISLDHQPIEHAAMAIHWALAAADTASGGSAPH